jgi:hypothetical protein
MTVPKAQVLFDAPTYLNHPNLPWFVSIEGDAIVARWKWMDALFFAPHEVTGETREYAYIVTLNDKGKYKEQDRTTEKESAISIENGQINFGASSSTFAGKKNEKAFKIGFGANNQNNDVGLVGFKYSTEQIKGPIRAFLESAGYKKAGLFG